MRIERLPDRELLGDVKIGMTFELPSDNVPPRQVYMRGARDFNDSIAAISLGSGECIWMSAKTPVVVVRGKFVEE